MKKLITLLFAITFVTACDVNPTAQQKEAEHTEKAMREISASVGMPSITRFQEKRWAKQIFELRDQSDLITYAYIVNLNGDLIYLGQCVGYGLPYSVQYTCPQVKVSGAHGNISLPQADPNGLYMPDGLSATWLMMQDPETGEIKPVYIEQEILVSPFKLK